MNQSDFEADLRRHGYQVFYGGLKADHVNTDHSHDWETRVMVIGGEITIRRQGKSETFRTGDSCAVAGCEVHRTRRRFCPRRAFRSLHPPLKNKSATVFDPGVRRAQPALGRVARPA